MKNIFILILLTGTFFFGAQYQVNAQTTNKVFAGLLRRYEKSIDDADTVLAAKLWAKTSEVSFIHPRGTEYGWSGVKNVIRMFAEGFSKRELHGSEEKVIVYGDVAWLTFTWVFDATFKANKQPIQTKGRETQIWRKIKGEWKLVHVHYSGMPVTERGQGF
jgi:hypothetical protein